ncbi:MAG: class I adenylate-forming enzyme family protein [Desulfatiglans sp.]|jgi:acyl-CoA synthetase (AMP-forming)/AMP-acid ligase II|nr:class I adenylate-forming enzyme family protein [Desulfatiglans sp.]
MRSKKATLIHHFLETSAHSYPDKTAIIYDQVRASYSEINKSADQLAGWLIRAGIELGDRVVLIMDNCLEYIVGYYGALKSGAVVASLSSDLKPDGLVPVLRELEPKIIISSWKFERLLQATHLEVSEETALLLKSPKLDWSDFHFDTYSWEDALKGEEEFHEAEALDESALASIIYTSGSTGKPKGVMLTHKNIVSNTYAICEYLKLTDKDIQMVVLPFFYVMGKSLLNTHFAVGGTVVINNKFAFPTSVVKQIVEEGVTGFSGVPATYAYLLHRSPLKKYQEKLGRLRYCSQAGGHMSRQIKRELREALPAHTEIYIMYGATEASARLTYLQPDRLMDKIDSIGKPIPGVTMKVLDNNGVEVAPGRKGELVGYGPNIMQGYWRDEEATSRVLRKNGYYTGDLGYQDTDGYLYVYGRKDSLVKVGGHRINPQEIEDALMATGLVTENLVAGVPDELLENRLVLIAVLKNSDCQEVEILRECAKRLPKYKLPTQVKLVRALPKNSNGKVDRAACLRLVGL